MTAETPQNTSCETTTFADEREEGEVTEKEDEDSETLISNASSLRSSLTWPSSPHTSITPATFVPEKPSSVNELCPMFTSTGTSIYNPIRFAAP